MQGEWSCVCPGFPKEEAHISSAVMPHSRPCYSPPAVLEWCVGHDSLPRVQGSAKRIPFTPAYYLLREKPRVAACLSTVCFRFFATWHSTNANEKKKSKRYDITVRNKPNSAMFNFGRQYMRNMWLSACVCVYWVYIEGFLRLTCRSLYLYVSTSQNLRFPFLFLLIVAAIFFFFFYLETNKAMHFLDGWDQVVDTRHKLANTRYLLVSQTSLETWSFPKGW